LEIEAIELVGVVKSKVLGPTLSKMLHLPLGK